MAQLKPRDGWMHDRLHWLEWGRAQAQSVVLVHEITGNAHNWDALAAAAAETRRIVALELRGHGESAWVEGEAYEHFDDMADLLAVIDSRP